MSHGLPLDEAAARQGIASSGTLLARLEKILAAINRAIVVIASMALLLAGLVLSYSVIVRQLLRWPTYWQDEAAVFLLVGATFLSAAYVQERRGHVAIEALVGLLPRGVNHIRLIVVDATTFLFCAFFAWKSWALLEEAWIDGQVSSSTWAPPLWIPYLLMAAGMTLLSLQVALQIVTGARQAERA